MPSRRRLRRARVAVRSLPSERWSAEEVDASPCSVLKGTRRSCSAGPRRRRWSSALKGDLLVRRRELMCASGGQITRALVHENPTQASINISDHGSLHLRPPPAHREPSQPKLPRGRSTGRRTQIILPLEVRRNVRTREYIYRLANTNKSPSISLQQSRGDAGGNV